MRIVFTKHAELKFEVLKKYGFKITKEQVEDTLTIPEDITEGRKGRLIAQRLIGETHVIRVIYEKKGDSFTVITFYPARRRRYES